MSEQSQENLEARGHDPARSRLRATVAKMKRELDLLAASEGAEGERRAAREALVASFDDLVQQLALGPEPEVRECPSCGAVCMRRATICSACWTKLSPPQ